jgi:hypothetical protein
MVMDDTSSHVIGFFVDAFCALILFRVATSMYNSRYLSHFSMAWLLFGVERIVVGAGSLLAALSESQVLPANPTGGLTLQQADTLVSISGNLFLVLGGLLMWQYPKQLIQSSAAQNTFLIFGLLILIITLPNFFGKSEETIYMVKWIDALTSLLAVLFIAICLIKLLKSDEFTSVL